MEWKIFDTYNELCEHAANLVVAEAGKKNDLLLGAATGASPEGLYQSLAHRAREKPALFAQLRVIQLDEWGGLPPHHPATCAAYLEEHLYGPLKIGPDRYVGWNGDAEDPQKECKRMQEQLEIAGRIDLCLLGLGLNGHIAFNEPGPYLETHAHIAQLTAGSQQHSMVGTLGSKPAYGLTLGMADILRSRMILLLIAGKKKREITSQLRAGQIATDLPASLLWLHANTICLVDREACE